LPSAFLGLAAAHKKALCSALTSSAARVASVWNLGDPFYQSGFIALPIPPRRNSSPGQLLAGGINQKK
jgi:altronate dehydratase